MGWYGNRGGREAVAEAAEHDERGGGGDAGGTVVLLQVEGLHGGRGESQMHFGPVGRNE